MLKQSGLYFPLFDRLFGDFRLLHSLLRAHKIAIEDLVVSFKFLIRRLDDLDLRDILEEFLDFAFLLGRLEERLWPRALLEVKSLGRVVDYFNGIVFV